MANRSNNRCNNENKICKFCKDSGKNENIYTSHNVKDKNGVICCPILMTTLCNNCKNFGHTIKFCKVVKKSDKLNVNDKKISFRVEIKKKPTSNVVKYPNNRIAVFEEIEEEAPEEAQEEVHELGNVLEIEHKMVGLQYPLRRRLEDWTEFCSDSDDE